MNVTPRSRLRLSPNFAVTPGYGCASLLVEQVHPYRAFVVDELQGQLACQFVSPAGVEIGRGVDNVLHALGAPNDTLARRRLVESLDTLVREGVLVTGEIEHSIYDKRMAQAYARHRAIPAEIGAAIAAEARIDSSSRVLDLATGTGSLAIELAAHSDHVTAMDTSFSFLAVAAETARRRQANVEFLQGSCNQLAHVDVVYDVVTLSQALHWLDPYALCRGLHRVLSPGGFFFLVNAAARVPAGHPLRPWIHHADRPQAIDRTLGAEADHLARLFDLTAPAERATRIQTVGACRFKQRRPFNWGFAKAYFTKWHRHEDGMQPTWSALRRGLASKADDDLLGDDFWRVTCFRKVPLAT